MNEGRKELKHEMLFGPRDKALLPLVGGERKGKTSWRRRYGSIQEGKTDRGVCGRREGGSKCVGGVSEAHSSPGDFKSLDLGGGF